VGEEKRGKREKEKDKYVGFRTHARLLIDSGYAPPNILNASSTDFSRVVDQTHFQLSLTTSDILSNLFPSRLSSPAR
jgi:hypothetical protein